MKDDKSLSNNTYNSTKGGCCTKMDIRKWVFWGAKCNVLLIEISFETYM